MSLTFDPETGKIFYRGHEVGQHTHDDNGDTVQLNITYSSNEEWIVPLSYFALGLRLIEPDTVLEISVEIETSNDEIEQIAGAHRFLIEKTVKVDNRKWRFHKNDPDDWPSTVHGHDYACGEKLDAFTGEIFDVVTRNKVGKLKKKALNQVQTTLKASDDFKDKFHKAK